MTIQILWGDNNLTVLVTCKSNEQPAKVCNTLGREDCIRLPEPAASITTLSFDMILILSRLLILLINPELHIKYFQYFNEVKSNAIILVQIQIAHRHKKGDICRLFCAYVLNNVLMSAFS